MTMLMRWNPLLPGNKVRDEFDSLFDQLARPRSGGWVPAADVHETADEFVVRMDLPGVAQKDVKVTLLEKTLTIRGERKFDETQKGETLHWRERTSGVYERTFRLTAPVRTDQIRAQYKDGVLEVHVPKAEDAKPREIEIQVG